MVALVPLNGKVLIRESATCSRATIESNDTHVLRQATSRAIGYKPKTSITVEFDRPNLLKSLAQPDMIVWVALVRVSLEHGALLHISPRYVSSGGTIDPFDDNTAFVNFDVVNRRIKSILGRRPLTLTQEAKVELVNMSGSSVAWQEGDKLEIRGINHRVDLEHCRHSLAEQRLPER